MAGQILGAAGAAADAVTRDAGLGFAIAGMLRAFAMHASRRQLYVPLDVLQRHGVDREDILAGELASRCARHWRTCAACSAHLAAAELTPVAAADYCRRCCRSRWSVLRCGAMTIRSGSIRCRHGAGNGCSGARRATRGAFSAHRIIRRRVPSHRQSSGRRSASARALSAALRARFLAEPRPNLRPSRSKPAFRRAAGKARNSRSLAGTTTVRHRWSRCGRR